MQIPKAYTITDQSQIYFCTDVITNFAYTFVNRTFFDLIIDSLKYCQQEKGLKVHAYVIMPNHIHSVISSKANDLSGTLRDFKRYTSKKMTTLLNESHNYDLLKLFNKAALNKDDSNFKVWQKGSHSQIMDYEEKLIQKIDYIHNNPVKKGYVEYPEHWIYSSARNYILDDNSIIQVDKIV